MKETTKISLSILFIFSALSFQAKENDNKDKKDKKHPSRVVYQEANVIEADGKCGYLLQLLNGRIIKPQSLPRKYRDNHLKVLVRFDEIGAANDSICHTDKVVAITEIKKFKLNTNLRAKY